MRVRVGVGMRVRVRVRVGVGVGVGVRSLRLSHRTVVVDVTDDAPHRLVDSAQRLLAVPRVAVELLAATLAAAHVEVLPLEDNPALGVG